MRLQYICALPLILAAAACGQTATTPADEATAAVPMDATPSAAPTRAVATLKTADGKDAGIATLLPAGDGIQLAVQVQGLPEGPHGIHIHEIGKCDGPAFTTAGSHWNPAAKKHGMENPDGAHAGDMPNLTVGADGKGIINHTLSGGTVADLLDGDGAAVVVHAKADDQKTDPSGDSGDRIACGVLAG